MLCRSGPKQGNSHVSPPKLVVWPAFKLFFDHVGVLDINRSLTDILSQKRGCSLLEVSIVKFDKNIINASLFCKAVSLVFFFFLFSSLFFRIGVVNGTPEITTLEALIQLLPGQFM